jgi:hypothetical protein
LNLTDSRDDSHRVENVGSGFVCIVPLCDRKYEPLALERGFDRTQSTGPTGRNRGGQTRKNHCAPKREHRKSLALSHGTDLYELSKMQNATLGSEPEEVLS